MVESVAILNRHQQNTSNDSNKEKNNFKGSVNKKSYPSEIQFELDACNRPQQKIALLCGSPGAGVSDRLKSFKVSWKYWV